MIRVVHPGSRIRMLTFSHPGSRIPGSKRHPIPDPGSGSATLLGGYGTVPGLSCRESDTLEEDQNQLLYEAAVIVVIGNAARLPTTESDAARLPAKAEGLSVRHPAQQVVKSH